ncbi:uncharacterized protein LOC143026276 [Oratosquilla oratoria]|uniref:uncharacterized protein LOC143026276 n=1 Tax=Oratosquilla oratoria TaxID=337810 RepID=UPI003F778185
MKVMSATRLLHLVLGHLLFLRWCEAGRVSFRLQRPPQPQESRWSLTEILTKATPPANLEEGRLEVERVEEEAQQGLVDPGGGNVRTRTHVHERHDVKSLPQFVVFSSMAGKNVRDPVTGRHRKPWTVTPAHDPSSSPPEDPCGEEEEEEVEEGRIRDKDKTREVLASPSVAHPAVQHADNGVSVSAEDTLHHKEITSSRGGRRRGGGEGGGGFSSKRLSMTPRLMPSQSASSPGTFVRVPADWEYLYRPFDPQEEESEAFEVAEDEGAEDEEPHILQKGKVPPEGVDSEGEEASSSEKTNQRGVLFLRIIPDDDSERSGRIKVKLRKAFQVSAEDENAEIEQDLGSIISVQLTGKEDREVTGGESRGTTTGGRETVGNIEEAEETDESKHGGDPLEASSSGERRSLRGDLLQRRTGEASEGETHRTTNDEEVEGRTAESLVDDEARRTPSVASEERSHKDAGYQYHYQDPAKGTYEFGYDTGTSRRHEERRPDGAVIGSYSWTDALGQLHVTNYVADALGYRVVRPGQQIAIHVTTPDPVEAPLNGSSSSPVGEFPGSPDDLLPAPTIPDKFPPSPPATGRPPIAHPLPGSSVSNGQGSWILVGSTPSTVPRPPPGKPQRPMRPLPPFISPFLPRPPQGQKPGHPTSIQDIIGNSPDPLKPFPEGGGFPLIPVPIPPVRPVLGVHGTLHGPNSTHLTEILGGGKLTQISPASGHRPDTPRPPPYYPWLPGQWIGSGQHQTGSPGSSSEKPSAPGGPFQSWGPFPQHPLVDLEKYPVLGLVQVLNNLGLGTRATTSSENQQQSKNHTEDTTTNSPPITGGVSSPKPSFRPWLGNTFKVPPPPPPPPGGWPTRRPFRPKPIPPPLRPLRPRPRPQPLRPIVPQHGGSIRPQNIPAKRPSVSLDYAFLESEDPEVDFEDPGTEEEQPGAEETSDGAGTGLTSIQQVFQGLMEDFSNPKRNKNPSTNKPPEDLQSPKPSTSLTRRPVPGQEPSRDQSGSGKPPQSPQLGILDKLFSNPFSGLPGGSGVNVRRPAWSYFSTEAPSPTPSRRPNTSSTTNRTTTTTTSSTTTTTTTTTPSTTTTTSTRPSKYPNTQSFLSALLDAFYNQPKVKSTARPDTLQ